MWNPHKAEMIRDMTAQWLTVFGCSHPRLNTEIRKARKGRAVSRTPPPPRDESIVRVALSAALPGYPHHPADPGKIRLFQSSAVECQMAPQRRSSRRSSGTTKSPKPPYTSATRYLPASPPAKAPAGTWPKHPPLFRPKVPGRLSPRPPVQTHRRTSDRRPGPGLPYVGPPSASTSSMLVSKVGSTKQHPLPLAAHKPSPRGSRSIQRNGIRVTALYRTAPHTLSPPEGEGGWEGGGSPAGEKSNKAARSGETKTQRSATTTPCARVDAPPPGTVCTLASHRGEPRGGEGAQKMT